MEQKALCTSRAWMKSLMSSRVPLTFNPRRYHKRRRPASPPSSLLHSVAKRCAQRTGGARTGNYAPPVTGPHFSPDVADRSHTERRGREMSK